MFIYTNLLVGPLFPGQVETLEFPYTDITIMELHPSCGCSDTVDVKEVQKVRVKITAPPIPVHLMNKPAIVSDKFIEVMYHLGDPKDVQKLKLTFKLTVSNPNHWKK